MTSQLSTGGDVSQAEIIALEEQSYAVSTGAGVGETIAHVQPGGMPALAVAVEGVEREFALSIADRHHPDAVSYTHLTLPTIYSV